MVFKPLFLLLPYTFFLEKMLNNQILNFVSQLRNFQRRATIFRISPYKTQNQNSYSIYSTGGGTVGKTIRKSKTCIS